MGGCRCSYRNCSSRTDGKTHMFHYPVFDKVRCHQWLTNAHKLEFINLKISQLKNRAVCQHHFKDDNFMNFKKAKLTCDAVPTEAGPYCDSSPLDETKTKQEESKVFTISLDDIQNEYLTKVDKKESFSVKYENFLTNCDVMDLDSLNSPNQIPIKGLCEIAANPIVPKNMIPSKRPVKRVQPLTSSYIGKHLGNSSQSIFKNTTHKKNRIIQANRRPSITILESQAQTQLESIVLEDCHHGDSEIEYDYSQRWGVESQQQNDSQETMMLDISTYVNLPDTDNDTITVKDISTQTYPGNSNITSTHVSSDACYTQTLLIEDPEDLKVANKYFGMFVARELSNVPQHKRREIMFEIVRLLQ